MYSAFKCRRQPLRDYQDSVPAAFKLAPGCHSGPTISGYSGPAADHSYEYAKGGPLATQASASCVVSVVAASGISEGFLEPQAAITAGAFKLPVFAVSASQPNMMLLL